MNLFNTVKHKGILALLVALLFTLPFAGAFGMITGGVTGQRQRVVDQEKDFYIELSDGTHEFYVTLDKPAALPIISMKLSGYAVGNFTVWIEPEGGGPKMKLAESKIVQKEPGAALITGFAAGGKGFGKGNNPGKALGKGKGKSVKTKSKSRRRLEALLNFLQGMLKGEAAFKARQQNQRDRGLIVQPKRFKSTCSDTCSISRPMVQKRYKLTAEVDGKLEVHGVQYSVIQNR